MKGEANLLPLPETPQMTQHSACSAWWPGCCWAACLSTEPEHDTGAGPLALPGETSETGVLSAITLTPEVLLKGGKPLSN